MLSLAISHTHAARLDRLQRKMVGMCLRVPMLDSDTPESYVRRRARLISQQIPYSGSWYFSWRLRVLDWDEHLQRPINGACWMAKLRNYRGAGWFHLRRAFFASARATAGRTNTRVGPGRVHTRWHDGIEAAAF